MHRFALGASSYTPLQPSPCSVHSIDCCKGQQQYTLLSQAARGCSLQGELIAPLCRGQCQVVQGSSANSAPCARVACARKSGVVFTIGMGQLLAQATVCACLSSIIVQACRLCCLCPACSQP